MNVATIIFLGAIGLAVIAVAYLRKSKKENDPTPTGGASGTRRKGPRTHEKERAHEDEN